MCGARRGRSGPWGCGFCVDTKRLGSEKEGARARHVLDSRDETAPFPGSEILQKIILFDAYNLPAAVMNFNWYHAFSGAPVSVSPGAHCTAGCTAAKQVRHGGGGFLSFARCFTLHEQTRKEYEQYAGSRDVGVKETSRRWFALRQHPQGRCHRLGCVWADICPLSSVRFD